jgi:protein-L-isoaspartate(D-aspartate) O-methyltransferase
MARRGGSPRVAAAFAAVPRRGFLTPDQVRFAALDRPLPIGHGQTISQPTTVRAMLELLDVRPGARVLDVGCGSGWTTALLACLVGPEGIVLGVEIVPQLVAFGRDNLARLPDDSHRGTARIVPAAPGVLGLPDEAPFDAILVSAEAASLPAPLVAQLRIGGVLVLPVAGRMTKVRREAAGVDVVRLGAYSFVPLVSGANDG